MNKIKTMYQKAVRIRTIVCGLLFSIFSFVYLFVFQRDVLEALHYSLAHGKTHFSPMGSALVMTLTLLFLTWGVNLVTSIKGRFHSLAYVPAFFVLMAISDVDREVYIHGGNGTWLWLLPSIFTLFIGLVLVLKKASHTKLDTNVSIAGLMGSNLLFLLIGCVATLTVGNTDENFHHELETERYLREKNYSQAMKVGERSLEASQTLTALRAIAMTNAGALGDELFSYPQYYGADGLFLPEDSLQALRYTNDSIYSLLGARPYYGEGKLSYLRTLCHEDKGKFTALHYYLSALLLKKRLDTFADELNNFYEPEDSLPIHFKEAILVYHQNHPKYPFVLADSMLIKRYSEYRCRQTEFHSRDIEKSQMRREFGNTYWWYHDYQE